jgi:4-carboxymuconolactone decarboxylase
VTRLDPMPPATLTPDQRALYTEIAEGPRAQGPQHFALTAENGALLGPFNAFLLSPGLGRSLQALGAAVRFETELTSREREIAILIVAAHWDSAFEHAAHEGVGRAAGLTEDELSELRQGRVPELSDAHEDAAARLAHALVRGDVSDEQWQRWTPIVGMATIFELTTLVGYYSTLALQLRAFRVDERDETHR